MNGIIFNGRFFGEEGVNGISAGFGAGAGLVIAVYFYNNFNEIGNIQQINPPKTTGFSATL